MEIIYWNNKVERFILELDELTAARVAKSVNLLEKLGHLLDMPDSKSLGKGLFELRTQGKRKVRILYVFHSNKAYIVHGFVKKAWKISGKDIEYARSLQREIERLV